ncbi:MAG: ComEC/Rec2 family competence protein [Clostridia bacterium]|nr:ComEC/Rec2 family competence protein [Clostridia bacterium]
MKRVVNVRPAVVAAAGIGVGAGAGFLCYYYGWSYLWLIAAVPVTAALLVIFIVKSSVRNIILTAFTAALLFIGFFGITYKLNDFDNKQLEDEANYYITGTVAEKGINDSGDYVKLKDVSVSGSDVDGKVYVYLGEDYGDYCEVGYTISLYATIYHTQAFAYGVVSNTRLIEDIRYTAYVNGGVTAERGYTVLGSINIKIRELLFDSAESDVAAVAYGMLTGNTEYTETSTMECFRYGGIAHVFAVSGLHIGLVFAAVTFLLKKLRLNRYVAAVLSVALIFLYAGVCGFTLSSVRAAIMCTVMLAVKLIGGKYDTLSAVSLAFIVIVLVNPLNVLAVGFQLSIAAVFGIALLSGGFMRLLAKIKIKGKPASVVSVAVSAQLATFPILLSSFGYVSWASLLMNIIFVPLLSAEFTLLFTCTILALIFQPIAQVILLVPLAPLSALMSLIVTVRAENALIGGFTFGALVPLYYAVILLLSDKINITARTRCALAAVGAAAVAVAVFVMNYVPSGRLKITASAWYSDSSAVLLRTSDADVLVISQSPSSYDISLLLRTNGVSQPDAIIILGDDECLLAYTQCGEQCSDIYVYYTNIQLQPYTGTIVHYQSTFTIDGVTYTFEDGGNLIAEYGGVTVGINMSGDVAFSYCDLFISETYSEDVSAQKTVYFRKTGGYDNIYELGDLQFTIKNGKLYG